MNFRKTLPLAFCALVATGLSLGTASIATAAEREAGPKALFYKQMDEPTAKSNTGVQYWIELKRNGRIEKVPNKFAFKTGDAVRFHIKPNIDGYAYILLKSGSRGERCVLFPNEKTNESNVVSRGKEVIIPGDGYLVFDENPGTERVALLLTRSSVDATAFLDQDTQPIMIASAGGGSKDLIPTKVYVSYGVPHGRKIGERDELLAAAAPEKKPFEPVAQPTVVNEGAKKATLKKDKDKEKEPVKVASATTTTAKKPPVEKKQQIAAKPPAKKAEKKPALHATASVSRDRDDDAVTTVVKEDSNTLHVDFALEHN